MEAKRGSKKYEEFAYVLDMLPHGRPSSQRAAYQTGGIIQIIGETHFTLLEATPRRDATINIRERIYVGKAGRTKVSHILGRISYEELTSSAKAELPGIIESIIRSDERRFLDFFNTSQPITSRMHAMELIPGIGKKLMWQILDHREPDPYRSFDDLRTRVNLPDPVKLVARRVMKELSEREKYLIFTRKM